MYDLSLSAFKAPDFGKIHEEKTRSQLLKQFMDAETLSSYPEGFRNVREEEQRVKMEARLALRGSY